MLSRFPLRLSTKVPPENPEIVPATLRLEIWLLFEFEIRLRSKLLSVRSSKVARSRVGKQEFKKRTIANKDRILQIFRTFMIL